MPFALAASDASVVLLVQQHLTLADIQQKLVLEDNQVVTDLALSLTDNRLAADVALLEMDSQFSALLALVD